jgi:hypothetical protein
METISSDLRSTTPKSQRAQNVRHADPIRVLIDKDRLALRPSVETERQSLRIDRAPDVCQTRILEQGESPPGGSGASRLGP